MFIIKELKMLSNSKLKSISDTLVKDYKEELDNFLYNVNTHVENKIQDIKERIDDIRTKQLSKISFKINDNFYYGNYTGSTLNKILEIQNNMINKIEENNCFEDYFLEENHYDFSNFKNLSPEDYVDIHTYHDELDDIKFNLEDFENKLDYLIKRKLDFESESELKGRLQFLNKDKEKEKNDVLEKINQLEIQISELKIQITKGTKINL
jgi:hypothetical protein